MSNELLEKVISTTSLGADGADALLRPDQADRFIDYMFDATVLGSQVDTRRLNGDEAEISVVGVGERLLRIATEASADHVVPNVRFSKVSLKTMKFRLDWELSTESLEDNIEGEALEDHVARMMATQVGNDLEDLAINGNVDVVDATLQGFDGWRKRLHAGGHVLDNEGEPLDKGVFNKALRTMPRNYMANRGNLKWFTSSGILQDYLADALLIEGYGGDRFQRPVDAYNAANGRTNVPDVQAGWSPAAPFGIRAQEVNLFPEYDTDGSADPDGSELWLLQPNNLLWGVKRSIRVYRQFVQKKDTIEYTLYTRVGAAVKNPHATVVVKNIKYKDTI